MSIAHCLPIFSRDFKLKDTSDGMNRKKKIKWHMFPEMLKCHANTGAIA
jgi:hypothetical protein